MSEQPTFQNETDESLRIHDTQLAHMGALITEAAMRSDLQEVVEDHSEQTGVTSPNSHSPNRLRIGTGEIPESSDSVYRSVDERALDDLADTGVVRGAYTARAMGAQQDLSAKTRSHTTYWFDGETGKQARLGQGFVIEAGKSDADKSWVPADKVSGVWARDNDGTVKNILPNRGE